MKLTRLEVNNFRKLTALNIDINGNVIEISGKNAAGKSSALDAPWVLLKGLSQKDSIRPVPSQPIHAGAEQATIKGIFKDKDVGLIVTRTFKTSERDPKGWTSKLEVTNLEGLTSKISPQQQLDAIIGEHRLDPIEFINLSPQEQLKAFRAFIQDVDFDLLEEQNDVDYKKRTEIGREVDKLNGAAAAITVPDMTPDVEIDVSALATELREAGEFNTQIEARKAKRKEVATKIESLANHRAANLKRIAELESQIAMMRTEIEGTERESAELQAKLDTAPELPAPKSTTLITQRIQDANSININVRNKQTHIKHIKAAEEAQAKYNELTKAIDTRKLNMELAVKNAELPLPNIGFCKTALLLNGLPFKEASTAEQIRTAVALSMSLHPQLRLMWIRDASLLDDDSLAVIYKLAEEYDCNVLLETVRPQSGSAIVLVDGHVEGTERVNHELINNYPEVVEKWNKGANAAMAEKADEFVVEAMTTPPSDDDDIL